MYYVYLIQSIKDKSFYIGFTASLKRRLIGHNSRKNVSTRNHVPYKLLYFDAMLNKKDALHREKYLKSGYGRRSIKKILKYYFLENK